MGGGGEKVERVKGEERGSMLDERIEWQKWQVNKHKLPLTHMSGIVERSPVTAIPGLDESSLQQEQRQHLHVAIVGCVMQGSLARTIPHIQVG